MMIPEVGSMPKVSGSSSATPDGGPMPGRAPMRMPRTTPPMAMTRLKGVSATEKPRARFDRKSIAASEAEHACRHRDLQPVDEDQVVHRRDRQRHGDGQRPRLAVEPAQQDDQERHGPERHADDLEQGDEGDADAEHEE